MLVCMCKNFAILQFRWIRTEIGSVPHSHIFYGVVLLV